MSEIEPQESSAGEGYIEVEGVQESSTDDIAIDISDVERTGAYRSATEAKSGPVSDIVGESTLAPAPVAVATSPPTPLAPVDTNPVAPQSPVKKKKEAGGVNTEIETDWHSLPIEQIRTRRTVPLTGDKEDIDLGEGLFSNFELSKERNKDGDFDVLPESIKGLTTAEAMKRQKLFGFNELTPPYEKPEWLKLLEEMYGGFSTLLWIGAILCFIAWGIKYDDNDNVYEDTEPDNLYLGSVLAFVVIVTGIFAYLQEKKSSDTMKKFKAMIPPRCTVIRDGEEAPETLARELVPGDVIKVESGNTLPADIRVLAQSGFKVDNASLTGESEAQKRGTHCTHANVLESANVGFFTTGVAEGTCTGLVIQTGDNTVIGQIKELVEGTETLETPIAIEIEFFIKIITGVAVALGVIFFFIALFAVQNHWLDCVIFLIGIIVANVPEGLLATVTVSLALTAIRMSHKNVLVKNLEAVETLGSTSCICSDKTGTLTQNKMTVVHTFCTDAVEGKFKESDVGIEMVNGGRANYETESKGFKALFRIAQLGSTAVFAKKAREIEEEDVEEKGFFAKLFGGPEEEKETEEARMERKASESKFEEEKFKEPKDLFDDDVEQLRVPQVKEDGSLLEQGVQYTGITRNQTWEEQSQHVKDEYCVKFFQQKYTKGDATETGILKFVDRINFNHGAEGAKTQDPFFKKANDFRRENPVLLSIPFNSKVKYAGAVAKISPDGQIGDDEPTDRLLLCFKGAPDILFDKCKKIYKDGKEVEKSEEDHQMMKDGNELLASRGRRVLGLAHAWLDPSKFPEDYKFEDDNAERDMAEVVQVPEMCFVGLIALIDPARDEVPAAVGECMNAGVKVIMVTGDHPITAKAIARDVGIIGPNQKTPDELAVDDGAQYKDSKSGEMKTCTKMSQFEMLDDELQDKYFEQATSVVIPGSMLKKMQEKGDLSKLNAAVSKEYCVFARTSPQQKLVIVQACQRAGHVVAVTGDGVNDSPALKAANIGVAMGITGSEVSKEAADMILQDDNFASIVKGVEEGRLIFDNLKKSIAYTLTSNIPEISPFLVYICGGTPLPLSTIMILAIDLGTDMMPAISLAYEMPESDIMKRKPRNAKTDNLVTGKLIQMTYLQIGVIQALAGFFCFFVVLGNNGWKPYDVFEVDKEWRSPAYTDMPSSYNEQWDEPDREKVTWMGQTSYFVSIVIVQWADVIICKTRKLSVFQQGMHNQMLNKGICFETGLAALLSYTPGTDLAFNTQPLRWVHWLPALCFSVLIFTYDETRKYLMRWQLRKNGKLPESDPKYGRPGWIEKETYY